MSDQLKVKAMISKPKNSAIIIEPEKVSVKQEEIQFIDESPNKNVDLYKKKMKMKRSIQTLIPTAKVSVMRMFLYQLNYQHFQILLKKA